MGPLEQPSPEPSFRTAGEGIFKKVLGIRVWELMICCFGHLDLGISDLFRISILGFRILILMRGVNP
jgi:hypothetical protein